MTNFIILSEQRVGSRWAHYLLSDLYRKKPSPEIDGRNIMINREEQHGIIRNYFANDRIPKIHHMHVSDLLINIRPVDYKVLSLVRNPRDRAVSVAFHHKHDPGKAQWPQRGMEDEEAVRYTVLDYDRYNVSNTRMLANMWHHYSVGNCDRNGVFAWVAYEWLLKNPVGTFKLIDMFLQGKKVITVEDAVDIHSFENKAKRKLGEEKRDDTWRRKGVNKDWQNWFDDELIDATKYFQTLYETALSREVDST